MVNLGQARASATQREEEVLFWVQMDHTPAYSGIIL